MNQVDRFSGEYAFLSNFYPSDILIDGLMYPTVEHAYQAQKTLDDGQRKQIAMAPTPEKAKRLGRSVPLRPDWESIKIDVMRQCIVAKFEIPELRSGLLKTYPRILIEGNTWDDTFWGCVWEQGRWHGRNELGKLLMSVRHDLMAVW